MLVAVVALTLVGTGISSIILLAYPAAHQALATASSFAVPAASSQNQPQPAVIILHDNWDKPDPPAH